MGPVGEAVRAEAEVWWEGGREEGEEGGDVEDAEWEMAGVFDGGGGEGEAEWCVVQGEAFAGEEEGDLGGRVGEVLEDEVEDVEGEGEEEGGGVGVLVLGCRVCEELG